MLIHSQAIERIVELLAPGALVNFTLRVGTGGGRSGLLRDGRGPIDRPAFGICGIVGERQP
jgi:hypothetical protein